MREKRARALVKRGKVIRQVAVLPFRRNQQGQLEILLMTSRGTGRFVIPKGWPMKGKPDWKAAALEAKQEAGLIGRTDPIPIGGFHYWKRLKTIFVPVEVVVYPMEVTQELPRWREHGLRNKAWLRVPQAVALIDEPELITLIDRFEAAHGASVGEPVAAAPASVAP